MFYFLKCLDNNIEMSLPIEQCLEAASGAYIKDWKNAI